MHTDECTLHSAPEIALISGAGSGIGRACALQLGKTHEVWVGYNRHQEQALEVVAEIMLNGGVAHALHIDYSNPATVVLARQQFSQHYAQLGKEPVLSVLVGNAGVWGSGYHLLLELEEQEWDEVWSINVGGVLSLFRQFSPVLRSNGAVITISSMVARLGSIGNKSQAHYVVTKAVMTSLFQALQSQPAWQHLRFISILPGLVDTGMLREHLGSVFDTYIQVVPIGHVASATEIANVVAFFARHALQISGHGSLLVDGGWAQKGWQMYR